MQRWSFKRCHERGWATLVVPVCLIITGLDSGRVAWFTPEFWAIAGFVSAMSVLHYRYRPSQQTLKTAVAILAATGMLRGVAYLPDLKTAPIAVHTLVATLAYAFYQAKHHDLPERY